MFKNCFWFKLFSDNCANTKHTKVVATKNLGTHVTTVLPKEKYVEAWLLNVVVLELFPT